MSASLKSELLSLIQKATEQGARKQQACELLGISLRSIERWEKAESLEDKRLSRIFEPPNKLSAAEEEEILNTANSERFCDLSPCQIVPLLADDGIYIASESTFYRILRRKGLLTHRQKSAPRKYHKPRALIATKPNQIWSWDITYLPRCIKGTYFYLYLAVDIFSRKIVGWHISEEETAAIASEFIYQSHKDENITEGQVVLHSDNGSPMKGATMLATLEKLGIATSFSRPSVSNDNPYSESLFRTLKYHRIYPDKPFETLDDARKWVSQFVHWYNIEHRHSAIQFVTPHQKHSAEDSLILANRKKVYEAARLKNPCRWSDKTRDWRPVRLVCLNPDKKFREQFQRANIDNLEEIMRQVA